MKKFNQFFVLRKDKNMLNSINKLLYDLPCPMKISYLWNFGSLLGITLMIQMITGVLLSMYYVSDISNAFNSIDIMNREINKGWILRYTHISGASIFFLFLYFHTARGIYFFSFNLMKTWSIGVVLLIFSMAAAFLGYMLPWGQMSYWGATVITNFFSVIPFMGMSVVQWMWGGFAVDYPTLTRFFSLHFLVPFILLVLVMFHLMFLHETGSNNPLGISSNKDKVYFFPFFLIKDLFGFFLFFFLVFIFFFFPSKFLEFQKFLEANSLVTPTHIQPEWYFLPAYAVLRSIPKKLGGVLALFSFIVMLFFIPLMKNKKNKFSTSLRNSSFNIYFQMVFWMWMMKFMFLIWVGACPVEYPFLQLSQMSSLIYFSYFSFYYFC